MYALSQFFQPVTTILLHVRASPADASPLQMQDGMKQPAVLGNPADCCRLRCRVTHLCTCTSSSTVTSLSAACMC